MDKKKIENYRAMLLAKRRELAGEVDNLRNVGIPVGDGPLDSGDEAAQSYARDVTLDISEAERTILKQIDGALDRLDSGDFGVCDDCGQKIAEKRLLAVPYADLCVECKSEKERGGR